MKNKTIIYKSLAVVMLAGLSFGSVSCNGDYIGDVENLGTFDDPEVAFKETQKALLILSTHLNVGMESVQYIQEYDHSKNLIFKPQ